MREVPVLCTGHLRGASCNGPFIGLPATGSRFRRPWFVCSHFLRFSAFEHWLRVFYFVGFSQTREFPAMSATKPFGAVAAVDAVTPESSDIVHPPRAIPRNKSLPYKNHVIIGDSPAEDEGTLLAPDAMHSTCQ